MDHPSAVLSGYLTSPDRNNKMKMVKGFGAFSPLEPFKVGGRGSDDRSPKAGGKSGLHRAGWSLTATGGDPRESATENIPPRVLAG